MNDRGLREIKKEATAQALAQAAFELALERGVDGFVIDDVASRAGYSRRTFANHYSCKEEALASVLLSGLRDSESLLFSLPKGASILDAIHASLKRQLGTEKLEQLQNLLSLCRNHPPLVPFILEAVMETYQDGVDILMEQVGGRYSRLDVSLLFAMAYGAVSLLICSSLEVLPPEQAALAGPDAIPLDQFLEATVARLRTGFESQ
jgi:AcrR family transcriptional regulator